MEPFYIRMAGQPIDSILRQGPAWGPLYALWLKPFVALLGDPLAVYAANVYALSLALSAAIYTHLLLRTRRAGVAVVAALVFLISDANVPLAGKASQFALLVLLSGWSLATWAPAGARRTAVATATVVVAAYARPELYPAAVVLCLVALSQAWRERHSRGWSAIAWPGTAVMLMTALALGIGTPVLGPSPSGGRLLDAFREHFAWNWSAWHGGQYFQAVWEQEFGDTDSVVAAVRVNPAAVAHHLSANLEGIAPALFRDSFRHAPLLVLPGGAFPAAGEGWPIGAAIVGALGAVAARSAWRRQMLARYGDALLWYAAVSALGLAAAIAIYPLQPYLVIPSVVALLASALAFTVLVPAPPVRGWPLRLVAAAVSVAVIPSPFASAAVSRPVTDTVAFVRGLHLPRPVHVLTLNDGTGDLMGPGYEEVKMWQKGHQPLEDYLRDRHVDVIVVMRVRQGEFVADDPYWELIKSNPGAAGFTRLAVPGHADVGVFVPSTPRGPAGPG